MMKTLVLAVSVAVLTTNAHAAVEAARVNEQVITSAQFSERYADQLRSAGPAMTSKKEVLEDMVRKEVAVQEAKKMKLDQDPAIQDRINSVLFFAYIEKKLGPEFERMGVTDNEAKAWYEKNPEIRTSHIFIGLSAQPSAEELKKAESKINEILKEIKSDKISFAEAAQRYSEDPSGPMGGDLDFRTKDRLDPTFYKAALRLSRPLEVSGVVRTAFGLHLIRLTGKRDWKETDRTRIKRLILEEKRENLVAKHLSDLRRKSRVTVNAELLR
jgi:hypothetical protein